MERDGNVVAGHKTESIHSRYFKFLLNHLKYKDKKSSLLCKWPDFEVFNFILMRPGILTVLKVKGPIFCLRFFLWQRLNKECDSSILDNTEN